MILVFDIIFPRCNSRFHHERRVSELLVHNMAEKSRLSFLHLSSSSLSARNLALSEICALLKKYSTDIFEANLKDIKQAENNGLPSPLLSRLRFDSVKAEDLCKGINDLISLNDPLGRTMLSTEITDGLKLYRVSCSIGVIGVIFESRPDALIQIASLALKSGNTVLLKGGSEALNTNRLLCSLLREAVEKAGLPADFAQLLESRDDVSEMLREDALIDLIIPRGSGQFVQYIKDNTRIPVLGHAEGICHVYIDRDADPEMAVNISLDSKTQNVSVCNAAETILIHRHALPDILPPLYKALTEKKVEIRGDHDIRRLVDCVEADDSDWSTEYLDSIVAVRVVDSVEQAVEHINRYGSHHTDTIVTGNNITASYFLNRVDSAGVFHNVSTRFSDGYVYGFGAEVGIATGKLHARGPMGLEGLTTYKYKLLGSGQTITEMKSGEKKYTHRKLSEICPL